MFDSILRTGNITPFENPIDPEVYERISNSFSSRSSKKKASFSISEFSNETGSTSPLITEKSSVDTINSSSSSTELSSLERRPGSANNIFDSECFRIFITLSGAKSGNTRTITPPKAITEKKEIAQLVELRA